MILAPRPHPLSRQQARRATHRKTEKGRQVSDWRGGRGWARSRIIRPQESLTLYKSLILSEVVLFQMNINPDPLPSREQHFKI